MAIVLPQETPQPIETPRLQPQADETTFGGGPGLAVQGQEIQQISKSTNEIATFEKIRADQTAVQSAAAQLAAVHSQLLTDPETGLPSYKGINAMEGHDKILAKYKETANELAKGLQPDQQGAFNRIAVEQGNALNQHAMAYVNGQIEQHDTNTFQAMVQNNTQLASQNYGQPDSVAMFKDQIDKITAARAKRLGLNPDETEDLTRKVNTNFHESVLSQMVNDPNFMGQAKQYFKDNKSEMDVESQDRVRQLIDTIPKQQKAESKAQQTEYYKANMKQAMLDMFDGKMSLGEAQRRFREGQLDKADYDTLETRLNKPDAGVIRQFEQSNPQTFNEIRQAQLTGSKDPGEIQRMIVKGAAGKEITPDDGKYLMGLNDEKPPTSRDKYIDAQANQVRDFANRYFAETNFLGMQTGKEKTNKQAEELVQSFYSTVDKSKAQEGDQINDLRDKVIKTAAQQRFPGLGKLDKMPDVVIDVKGRVTRLLNPDQHSGLKPKYKVTAATESDRSNKEEQ